MQSESGTQLTLPRYPKHWLIGQLLDVRNTGADYQVLLYGEDWHRAQTMRFADLASCQDFVSWWYMHHAAPERYLPADPIAPVTQKRTIKLARPNVSNR